MRSFFRFNLHSCTVCLALSLLPVVLAAPRPMDGTIALVASPRRVDGTIRLAASHPMDGTAASRAEDSTMADMSTSAASDLSLSSSSPSPNHQLLDRSLEPRYPEQRVTVIFLYEAGTGEHSGETTAARALAGASVKKARAYLGLEVEVVEGKKKLKPTSWDWENSPGNWFETGLLEFWVIGPPICGPKGCILTARRTSDDFYRVTIGTPHGKFEKTVQCGPEEIQKMQWKEADAEATTLRISGETSAERRERWERESWENHSKKLRNRLNGASYR